ncbi:MAG: hypothetical protein WBV69_12025 [Candidatus Sulfotelmatobacter sp.]
MLTRKMMVEHVPEDGTYSGSARMLFRDPEGSVDGKATIKLSADGHAIVRIDVDRYSIPAEYRNLLMAFLQGSKPEQAGGVRTTFHIGEANRFGSLEVTTAEGTFRADSALVGGGQFRPFGGDDEWFEVVPYGLELLAADAGPDEIWCAPLFGDLAEYERCANACLMNGRTPYLHFVADGRNCGLVIFGSGDTVPVPDGKFGAAVFGVVGNRKANRPDEVSALIPWGLFAALSFASGSDIQAPWIELRGCNGELKRRFHLRHGGTLSEGGFATLSRFDSAAPNSGIGEFLRLFFGLPEETRRAITPTMLLVRRGSPGSATVDESITNLIKALDATRKRQELGRVNLQKSLDAATALNVESISTEAREKLRKLRQDCKVNGKLDQLAILDKIISRQANVASDELDFGITAGELLAKFGLCDAEAMEKYYSTLSPEVTWEGLLSFIRGEVVHAGAIHVEDRAEIVSWFELARHLHDICKRVILREIGYNGTYSASNVRFRGTYALDRITASTTPAQLGYTVPPTVS